VKPERHRTPRSAWRTLQQHARRLSTRHLRELLADPQRPATMTVEAAGLLADFSKQRLDGEALAALFSMARAARLDQARALLFSGAIMNPTENRPALHMALRGVGGSPGVAAEVAAERSRIRELANRIRGGGITGFSGQPLRHLVCIGIGGSDLGPRLVCDALAAPKSAPSSDAVDVRFVANVDPSDLQLALAGLDPARTGFVIVSKTFTTRETLANAQAARGWLQAGARAAGATGIDEAALARHLIGVTANPQAAVDYGIAQEQVLRFWDWVGGRYSLWSSVGISIAVACGPDVFDRLLEGAAAMDAHFRDAPVEHNLPAWLGLLSIWNRNGLGCDTQAVIPYAERLRLLPSFLQQLIMESNGKSALLDGSRTTQATAPVIWGVSGTNAQHSFFQQLHQGPDIVPVDFIVAQRPEHPPEPGDERHDILLANCLAQSAALALGKPLPDADAGEDWHKAFPGNRPSTTVLLPAVEPAALGALLAAYEHATFTASVILGINAFDQFGVEYGKVMATSIEAVLGGRDDPAIDPATRTLIARIRQARQA
jgi:glucose-6-phosphate isomerase